MYARRFDRMGLAIGGEFLVNTQTTLDQLDPALDVAPDGSFTVVWGGEAQDGSGFGVFGQRFDPSGGRRGAEFRVNEYTFFDQHTADHCDRQGGERSRRMAVAEPGRQQLGRLRPPLRCRRARPSAGEFRVSVATAGAQYEPAVAVNDIGDFAVAFLSGGDLWARRFAADADAPVGRFPRQYHAAGNAIRCSTPSVASDSVGNLVMSWDTCIQAASLAGCLRPAFRRARPLGAAGGHERQRRPGAWRDRGPCVRAGRTTTARRSRSTASSAIPRGPAGGFLAIAVANAAYGTVRERRVGGVRVVLRHLHSGADAEAGRRTGTRRWTSASFLSLTARASARRCTWARASPTCRPRTRSIASSRRCCTTA